MEPLSVAVIGGGPAGLMIAEIVAIAGLRVTVFEHMPSVGRKLLLAGRGGLNITHTESLDSLLDRYGAARTQLEPSIRAFGPEQLRAWCAGLGEDPFVGTSGRVFPSGFRATPLLRAWLKRLDSLGVTINTQHSWTGWSTEEPHALTFTDAGGDEVVVDPDAAVLALGGASWPGSAPMAHGSIVFEPTMSMCHRCGPRTAASTSDGPRTSWDGFPAHRSRTFDSATNRCGHGVRR